MKVNVEELIKELSKPDGIENYKARVRLRNETARVGGKGQEAERKELAAALAKAVQDSQPKERRRIYDRPFANTPMRSELLRSLCEIAGAAEVPVLMKAIEDFEVRDFIRRAISGVPGDEATAALATMAVKGEGNEFRVGAINALGSRNTTAATEALRTCAADPDPRIRLAAAEALSRSSDPANDAAIATSFDPNRGWAPHANAARTRLRLAGNVARTGNKPAADQILQGVLASRPEEFQAKAATMGLQQQPQARR
jgi:HEAT repeat protein